MSEKQNSTLASETLMWTRDLMVESAPANRYRITIWMYIGWSALVWLSMSAKTIVISSGSATFLLFGIIATNVLFLLAGNRKGPKKPAAETITLAQCFVGIGWATLFAFMSSKSEELVIGVYASIVLFAIMRVKIGDLNKIVVLSLGSYLFVSLFKILSTYPVTFSTENLVPLLIFASIMLALLVTGRHVYRGQRQLEAQFIQLQSKLDERRVGAGVHSFDRSYILDLLRREKGRTDRTNVPFSVCAFYAAHVETSASGVDESAKLNLLKNVESIIRTGLRDMDAVNMTDLHNGADANCDKQFIAVLPETNLSNARRPAERVLAAVTMKKNETDQDVRFYGGIAQYRRGETIDDLLSRVENAMDKARVSDISCICESDNSKQPETVPADIVRLQTRRR